MSKHVFRLVENTNGGDNDDEDGAEYIVHISGKKLVHFEESAIVVSGGGGDNTMNDEDDNESGMMDAEGETRSVEAVGFCPADVVGTANWVSTGGVLLWVHNCDINVFAHVMLAALLEGLLRVLHDCVDAILYRLFLFLH